MIHFRVLGTLDLRDLQGEPIDALLAQPKRLALLAYLAVATPRGFQRRDVLVALLWPELDQPRARNALSQALHYLRRSLGSAALTTRGDEEIGLAAEEVWCDARAFDDALESGRIDEALALFVGDLLPGFFVPNAADFERWLEDARASYRARAATTAWSRASQLAERGDVAEAVRCARWASNLVPDDEAALRRLVELLDRVGDRAGALRAYDDFARRLAEEYESAPSAETQQLLREVRSRDATRAVGTVRTIDTPSPTSAPPSPNVAVVAPVTSRFRRPAAVIGLAAIALLATFVSNRVARPARVADASASIAVLPFLDLSPEHQDEYLSDGMAEELSDALSRVDRLRVTSRTSAFAFKGKSADARTIGRALGVDVLLEGSVRRESNTIRVTAQLIDARTGYHRWSRTYDREMSGVFAVQDEIARAIVGELALQLTGANAKPGSLARHSTSDIEAYTLYLQGRHFWNQRTAPAIERAITYFERAIAKDSNYASAYAGLADAYDVLAGQTYLSPDIAFPKAKAAAIRAVTLDSSLVEAHAALGFIHLFGEWDGAAAVRELDQALALDPSYASARLYRAFYDVSSGRPNDAVVEIRRAQALDPLSLIVNARVGFMLVMAHRFDEAIAAEQHALELDSTFAPSYWSLGDAYVGKNQFVAGAAQLEKARAYSSLMLGDLGYAYAVSGNIAHARRFLQELDERARTDYVDPYDRALVYVGLNDRDEAFRWLEIARTKHSASIIWLRAEPMLDRLRPDPRFAELVRKVGL